MPKLFAAALLAAFLASTSVAHAQEDPARVDSAVAVPASRTPALAVPPRAVPPGALRLSLAEAIEIAVERAYAVRLAGVDVATARAQVREAYGSLYPRLDASSSYTRNVVQANPFAGSSAGNIFGGLGAIGWLQYNESARTDGDPATAPITLDEYNRRVSAGQAAIGYNPASSSNPFGTDNQIVNALSLSQPLYSGTAFAAVRGARSLVAIQDAAREQRLDETIHQTRTAYYAALLAEEQATVQRASVERSRRTSSDAALLVAQGVRPKLERLNAEVDLANAETSLVTSEARAESARDQLLLTIGLPVGAPVVLEGRLDEPPAALFLTGGLAGAAALDLRPDVQQAQIAVRLNQVQRDITKAAMYPSLSLFADLSYVGNVPDDRTSIFTPDPNDPFTFQESSAGFFSDAYFQPAVSVGLRLNWTLFDGFQTRYRVQQNQLAIDAAEIQLEQARNAASLEVAAALRDLSSARRRLQAQRQTVGTAETAFLFASERLEEGVASQADVRISSQNLDLARLNYLQAVYDALVARSNYERATGTIAPAPLPSDPTSTASR